MATTGTLPLESFAIHEALMSDVRGHLVGIRLDTSELKRLDAVAAHYGLTRSNVIRMLVKRAHDGLESTQIAPKSADAGPRKRRTGGG